MLSNNNTGGGLKQLLSNFDLETVKPLLTLFGVDENALDALSGDNLQNLLSGNGDILSLIKTLLPIISAVYSATKGYGNLPSDGYTRNGGDNGFNGGFGDNPNNGFGGGSIDYGGLGGGSDNDSNGYAGNLNADRNFTASGVTAVKDLLSPDNLADLEECLQNNE